MVDGIGSPDAVLTEENVKSVIEAGTPPHLFQNKRVLVLTPDATRTCPLPMMIRAVRRVIGKRSAKLDFMVSLGTHPPLSPDEILELYGISLRQRQAEVKDSNFFNNRWDLPDSLTRIGRLESDEIAEISAGRLRETVPIAINKTIFDYDLILILGPVFPHEVVGYSGGAKYLFPGIAGQEIIDMFHWLGALITIPKIIGTKRTAVREIVDRAAAMLPVARYCFSLVVSGYDLSGLYAGIDCLAVPKSTRYSNATRT